ncbi:RCC1-like domain-containing protein, partial [Bifidobacterium indicum]
FTRPVTQDTTITAHWTKTGQWTISPDHGPKAGGTTVTLTPPPASGIRFSQTSAGDMCSMGIDSKGDLYTWGDNLFGELGRDTGSSEYDGRPGRVTPPTGITSFTQASAGDMHSMAIGSDGNLYTWGDNYDGQLGRDTTGTPANRPGRVTPPTGVTFTQASARYGYSMAFGSDGNLYTWGDNSGGQLGRDTTGTPYDRPGRVTPPTGVTLTQFAGGDYHSMAIGSDGNLYTWGDNSKGQLGRDTTGTPYDRPGRVTPPTGVTLTQISANGTYSMALGSDGNLYTWGDNSSGQLGRDTGSSGYDGRPGRVTPPTGVTSFTQANAGSRYSMALGSDRNLYTWGANDLGQLGRETNTTINGVNADIKPGRVTAPAGITFTQSSEGGNMISMAFGSDGNLYTWGNNNYGQLGRDTANIQDGRPGRVVFPSRGKPTGVLFDHAVGTGLMPGADGTWTVTTPAHAAGVVPVTISWTLDGTPQADDTSSTYRYDRPAYTVTFDANGGT